MDEFQPWDNNDDDGFGIENYDSYTNDSRRKSKRRLGIIIVGLISLAVCVFVLTIRSFFSMGTPTMESNITEIVVVHTATPGRQLEGVDIGLIAPDFTLKTINGDSITLSSLRGQVILLNFWATWCVYCRDEMPAFQNVYEELKDDGFIVISITEEAGSELDKVTAFKEDYGLTFQILLDESGAVSSRYYITDLPRTLLITPEGVIHKIIMGGPITEDVLKQELSAMQR